MEKLKLAWVLGGSISGPMREDYGCPALEVCFAGRPPKNAYVTFCKDASPAQTAAGLRELALKVEGFGREEGR